MIFTRRNDVAAAAWHHFDPEGRHPMRGEMLYPPGMGQIQRPGLSIEYYVELPGLPRFQGPKAMLLAWASRHLQPAPDAACAIDTRSPIGAMAGVLGQLRSLHRQCPTTLVEVLLAVADGCEDASQILGRLTKASGGKRPDRTTVTRCLKVLAGRPVWDRDHWVESPLPPLITGRPHPHTARTELFTLTEQGKTLVLPLMCTSPVQSFSVHAK